VSFAEAATAFADPLSLTTFDPDHSDDEDRYLLLGATHSLRLVVVSHTHRDESIRLISARLASKGEQRTYASGQKAEAGQR
jgi:uncharacterized DUF497 family protein